jgi:hypothetical protein
LKTVAAPKSPIRLGVTPYTSWGKRSACHAFLAGKAARNDPHSEPAVGMLEGVFTQGIGIVPIFAWRASARW